MEHCTDRLDLTVPFCIAAAPACVLSFRLRMNADFREVDDNWKRLDEENPILESMDSFWLKNSGGFAAMLFNPGYEMQHNTFAVGRFHNEIRKNAFHKWIIYCRKQVFSCPSGSTEGCLTSSIPPPSWLYKFDTDSIFEIWNVLRYYIDRVAENDLKFRPKEITPLATTPKD